MIRLALLSLLLAVLPAQVHEWRGIRFHGVVEPVAVGSTIALVVWSTDTDVALQFAPGAPRLHFHGIAWFSSQLSASTMFTGSTDGGCGWDDVYHCSARVLDDYRIYQGRTIGPLTGACHVTVTNYRWSAPPGLFARAVCVSPVNGWNQ